jgi:hypothetical protein
MSYDSWKTTDPEPPDDSVAKDDLAILLNECIQQRAQLLQELRDLCDVASTADLPLRVRDQAHKGRLVLERLAHTTVRAPCA